MKHALLLLTFAVIGMFVITPVTAATSQNLEWGIATGDKYDFTMTFTYEGEETLNEEMFINVTEIPASAIPDPLTDWDDIPQVHVGMYWKNGSDIGLYALVFIGMYILKAPSAVPIGNFDLLTQLLSDAVSNLTIINDSVRWGFEKTSVLNSTHSITYVVTYLKEDGLLAEFRTSGYRTDINELIMEFQTIRVGLPSSALDAGAILQMIQQNPLLVAAGVIGIILVIVIIKKR